MIKLSGIKIVTCILKTYNLLDKVHEYLGLYS